MSATIPRSFTLSNKIDQDRISAQLDDGVLTLTLPKAKEAQPRKISIELIRRRAFVMAGLDPADFR